MDIVCKISTGREFHSLIVHGKKEKTLKIYYFALGNTNLKAWLQQVLHLLFGFRWPFAKKSFRLWESSYIIDGLAVFLLVARVTPAFLLHLLKGCCCLHRTALPFSELSPALKYPCHTRNPLYIGNIFHSPHQFNKTIFSILIIN